LHTVDPSSGELFFGLVGAVGTNLRSVQEALEESLSTHQFQSLDIGISDLLRDVKSWKHVPSDLDELRAKIPEVGARIPEDDRIILFMNLGNVVRKMFNHGDALAVLAISAVREKRRELSRANRRNPKNKKPKGKNQPEPPLPRTAFILRSLKNPEEVSTLRRVYGRRFFVMGATSPRETRIEQLAQEIADTRDNPRWMELKRDAERLSERDEEETGEPLGQNVRDTFKAADVFVDAADPKSDDLRTQVQRFVDLVFGNQLRTPTRQEYGMFHAHAAAARSAALSRQVGAAIATADGSVVSLGTNEVPKAGGGLYWPDDKEDSRDFRRGFDQSDIMERAIITEILQKLDKQKWLAMPRGYDKLLTELRIPKERREQIINQFATILTKGFLARLKQAKDDAARISDKEKAAAKDLTKLLTELRIPKERREQITKVVEDIMERGANAEGYLISLLETAFSPIMKRSRVTELTEYNRTVHAEAAALLEATRNGTFAKDCTIYTTTFPCHVCTRLIVAAGVRQVVYIEPYPKSYAEEQHGDAISVNKSYHQGRVGFVPFVGVAPRQYLPFFSLDFFDRKRKDQNGNVSEWAAEEKGTFREPPPSYIGREIYLLRQRGSLINAN
jgi:deoxycytidylate deaminase